jgi:hypothetical protein
MKPSFAIVIAGMLCTGCAPVAPAPEPVTNRLDQADAKMAAADYRGAQALYAEFVVRTRITRRQPGCAQTRRPSIFC